MKTYLFPLIASFILISTITEAQNDPFYPFHPTTRVSSFQSSHLPVVIIELSERMANKEDDRRVPASMKIIWDESGERNSIDDTEHFNYNGNIEIKYRGNSSYYNSDKKPFSFRTRNASGGKLKVPILGMGADDDWALLAPFNDKSLIRDVTLFELMKGTLEYVPSGKYCELILNGVYQGIYIMAARVRQGENRINIPEPSDDNDDKLSGGYHLEIDRSNEPGFWGEVNTKNLFEINYSSKTYYQYKYPDEEDLSQEMKNYIISYVKEMEHAVAGEDFKNPSTGYRAYLDILSMIDYMIAQEFSKNVDGYRLSTPIYKYRDSYDKRFRFSIWDFNISMGNADYTDGWSPEGWAFNNNRYNSGENNVPWMFKRVLQDEIFYSNLKDRWTTYRNERLSDTRILEVVDSLSNLLNEAKDRNFVCWNRFNTYVWPNYYISSSWNGELEFLKEWLLKRVQWIDSQWSRTENVNRIANAGFEASTTRGVWNQTNLSEWETSQSNAALNTSNTHNGNYSLQMQRGSYASQVITELESGLYTFKVWTKTEGSPNAYLTIKYHNDKTGANSLSINIDNSTDFRQIEVNNIEVINRFAELRFTVPTSNTAPKLWIDDIVFSKQEEIINIESERGNQTPFFCYTNKKTMSVYIEIQSNELIGQTVYIYDIIGNRLHSSPITETHFSISNKSFQKNRIYIINIGNSVQKIIW